MNSKIYVHLIGHLSADPRYFDLRAGGVGCELRLNIARPDFDAAGGRITRPRYVKAVTFDTRLAAQIRDHGYSAGDFVELAADDLRAEKPWYAQKLDKWLGGDPVAGLTKIRKVTALTPDPDQPQDPAAAAETAVLDGVNAASPQPAQAPAA